MATEQEPQELLKMMEDTRLVRDKLALLYPVLLKKKEKKVEARDLAEEGLKLEVWPLLDEWEANVQLRTHAARDWMNEAPKGIRNAYKTPKRGRQPFHECKQEELKFDIWEKVEAGTASRIALQSDIINYKLAFKETPTGPNGEKLPEWVWSEQDEKMFALIEGRVAEPALKRG